ncbi:molybdate ABC transporter substrate-binding protein [Limnothrix sp. FACHB-708]|nr:molybdate ABC transporter substrate-binding protein [Limnothrix sp. FACHB-406]MBD2555009.1 molybdate ABC transporter substrate-binding protein [Limnothrix sp. FACHB-708]MBD2591860.1 molybdate ABC transporter substrate-binding protein [Limnothrix sp. FACHB-406]
MGLIVGMVAGCRVDWNGPNGQAKPQQTLTVSAAASLQPALTTLQAEYRLVEPTVQLSLNFGSSGALKQQILQGAPVDLFISADAKTMAELAGAGLVDPATQRDLLSNELVLVARPGVPLRKWQDVAGPEVKFLAIGDPERVPVGRYARATLVSLDLWRAVQPKLVLGQDARQVLTAVVTGNADAGVVYASDVRRSTEPPLGLVLVGDAPPGSHPPITYPIAVMAKTRQPAAARQFADWLGKPTARSIFVRYGFVPLSLGSSLPLPRPVAAPERSPAHS